MYRSIGTSSPYGKLALYVQPYPFPLPWGNRPAPPAAKSQVVSRNVSGLGQSATGHRSGGWLHGYVKPYGFPLPWQPSGMGDYVSTAPPVAAPATAPAMSTEKLVLGAIALGAVGWFVWKHRKG